MYDGKDLEFFNFMLVQKCTMQLLGFLTFSTVFNKLHEIFNTSLSNRLCFGRLGGLNAVLTWDILNVQ